MTIKNAFVIKDGVSYFCGSVTSNVSGNLVAVFAPLSSRTRTYADKRKADSAKRWVNEHYESPYVEIEYIESADVPDEPKQDKEALQEIPATERHGWTVLDRLCGKYPAIVKKGARYAVMLGDEMYYLPDNERSAWQRYFRECEKFVTARIDAREKKNLGA